MIRQDGEALLLDGPVTLETVPEIAAAVAAGLEAGVASVDFTAVTEVDSAAVALALEWMRAAELRRRPLRLQNLPMSMQNLAKLYGVSQLLQPGQA